MPKKIKIKRKSVKEPDEFISTMSRVADFGRSHWRNATVLVAVALAVIIGAQVLRQYRASRQEAAMVALTQALDTYTGVSTPTGDNGGATVQQQYFQAIEAFQNITRKYPRSFAAQAAELYLGNANYALKLYDKAIPHYEAAEKAFEQDATLQSLAAEGLARSYESKGDCARAISYYQKLADSSQEFMRASALYGLGHCYVAENELEKAQTTYQLLLAEFPDSSYRDAVQFTLSSIESKVGSDGAGTSGGEPQDSASSSGAPTVLEEPAASQTPSAPAVKSEEPAASQTPSAPAVKSEEPAASQSPAAPPATETPPTEGSSPGSSP